MTDVVEAMARALCNAERLERGWPFVSNDEWHEVEGYDRYMRLARAAIRACHAAEGLVVGKMPQPLDYIDSDEEDAAYADGHNAALAAVRAAAVEVE